MYPSCHQGIGMMRKAVTSSDESALNPPFFMAPSFMLKHINFNKVSSVKVSEVQHRSLGVELGNSLCKTKGGPFRLFN